MAHLYLLIEGQQQGPFTEEMTREALQEGLIPPDLLAWYEGLTAWVPVSSLLAAASSIPTSPVLRAQAANGTPSSGHRIDSKKSISRHAIATLVLAILGLVLFPVAGFFAFIPTGVESFLATRSIKNNGYRGGWMVKSAGYVVLLTFLGVIAFAVFIAASSRH